MSEIEVEKLIRHASLLVLSGVDIAGQDVEEALDNYPEALTDDFGQQLHDIWDEVKREVRGVHGNLEALNDEIRSVSPRWKVERMAPIDRSLLRLGMWEILYDKRPPIEVIDHSVDLAKDYGAKKTSAFVNGLLDQFCKNHKIAIQ